MSVYSGNTQIGTEDFVSQYEGSIYQFANAENKNLFDIDPKKYEPKYGGYCSIAVGEGILVETNPHSALLQDGELHVFYKDDEEDTQDEWNENPIENKQKAEIQWIALSQ